MAKKINITGRQPKRIRVIDKPQRRIEPAELAAALGAEPRAQRMGANLDPISLAELGTQLMDRLRSTGGRPALSDATELCRVPLSGEDVKALETITEEIQRSTGTKPSPGQLASIIVRDYLNRGSGQSHEGAMLEGTVTSWPEGWNGKRAGYRFTQQLIEAAKTTWGRRGAA